MDTVILLVASYDFSSVHYLDASLKDCIEAVEPCFERMAIMGDMWFVAFFTKEMNTLVA